MNFLCLNGLLRKILTISEKPRVHGPHQAHVNEISGFKERRFIKRICLSGVVTKS